MDESIDYFQPLADKLVRYLDPDALVIVRQAYDLAAKYHEGQKRKTGEDYITHPVAAAVILAELQLGQELIIATLLHDVIEDTGCTKETIEKAFGKQVAELVDGVSKLTQIKFSSRAEAQAENFRKMLMAMVRDIRVMIVKLADRLHNMRTLGVMPRENKRRKARETLEIYAPIAHRLGIHPFFTELEDLGFQALYPLRHRVIEQAVYEAKKKRRQAIDKIIERFSETLKERGVTNFKLYNRHRHLYGIYRKIKSKTSILSEIMDRDSFRIIVDKADDCYRALGSVHSVFTPRPDRFRDYIAIPKANGYQALHTTLFGPEGATIDVQIRTQEMEDLAEHGVAARWIHHSDYDHQPTQSRAKRWVNHLLEMQQSSSDSMEFIETVKNDLFPKEIYVFTPDGDIMALPRKATPVDFAYAVHSDIGDTCVAAKIDRKLSPLSKVLKNGQTIEIITANGASPSPAWLSFVVTSKARAHIKHFLKNQKQAQSKQLGERMLSHVISELGFQLDKISKEQIQSVLQQFKINSFDELCVEIGLGNKLPLIIADALLPELAKNRETQIGFELAQEISPLVLKGAEGMIIKFAECCHPIPGDPIVGCLQAGSGILVHIESCASVKHFRHKLGNYMPLRWEEDVQGEFQVTINVEVRNRRGVLAMLATAISDQSANIVNIGIEVHDNQHHTVKLIVGVKNTHHLTSVMNRLRLLPVVNQVERIDS